jgi:glycine cleavage system aminomethyltransferase T
LLARSGWSKQGGFELYLCDGTRGTELWNRVKDAGESYGIVLGAPNDIERIESGLLSYGADARCATNPFEVGLGHLVDLERDDDFVGKIALQKILDQGVRRRRVGLIITGEPISAFTHAHDIYLGDDVVGTATEAVYSPRLDKNIAVALLNSEVTDDERALQVDIGQERLSATVSVLPFC